LIPTTKLCEVTIAEMIGITIYIYIYIMSCDMH